MIASFALACLMMVSSSFAVISANAHSKGAVTIEDIVQLREISGLDVCPSRNLIAIRTDSPSALENRVRHHWTIVKWPSGRVLKRFDAGESILTSMTYEKAQPQWSPNCRWIYYRALYDDAVQVWRLDVTSGAKEKVTSDQADILNFALLDGRALVYETSAPRAAILGAEEGEYRNGVLVDESIYLSHPIVRNEPLRGRWTTIRRPRFDFQGHLLSDEPFSYKVLSIRGRNIRGATESEIAALMRADLDYIGWRPEPEAEPMNSPTGDKVALVKVTKTRSPMGRPLFFQLASTNAADQTQLVECTDHRCTVELLVPLKWSLDGTILYFLAEQTRGAAGLYAWAPESGNVRTIHETEGTLGAMASTERYKSKPCPIMEDTAFCTAADHGSPPRLLAISLKTGESRVVFDPNAGLRERFDLKTERIRWKDGFGREALGVLVYPRGFKEGEQYPLVITTYQCKGFLAGGIADGGPEYALAENGLLALCIDMNWDLPPSEETAKYSLGPGRYVAALSEYEAAIDLLVERGLADRSRVGITGLSFSSQAVSYALTHSDDFQVVATRSLGVWEPGGFASHPNSELAKKMAEFHNAGDGANDPEEVMKDIAVSLRAERVKAPILVQPSDSEFRHSLPAFVAFTKLGKPVEMIVFPDETHQLHQPVHRFVNFTRNLDWFRFWLQDYEDPSPEKAEQYTRWRAMRDEQCERLQGNEPPWYCRQ